MRENQIVDTKNKFADQPAHPSRLARDFVIRYLESKVSKLFLHIRVKYCSWADCFRATLGRQNPKYSKFDTKTKLRQHIR